MKALSLSAWFMWCSLAGFGIILPHGHRAEPGQRISRLSSARRWVRGFHHRTDRAYPVQRRQRSPTQAPTTPCGVVPRTLCNNPLAAAHAAPLADAHRHGAGSVGALRPLVRRRLLRSRFLRTHRPLARRTWRRMPRWISFSACCRCSCARQTGPSSSARAVSSSASRCCPTGDAAYPCANAPRKP